MRASLVSCLLLLGLVVANAQEQETKLLDRLLKPDLSLQNNAQEKRFVADGAITNKQAQTKAYYLSNRTAEKEYAGVRQLQPKGFATPASMFIDKRANTSTRTRLSNVEQPYGTTAYVTKNARETEKSVEVSNYAGTRPFLGRGKSQKALSARDRQLTIDEVRELLNKNK